MSKTIFVIVERNKCVRYLTLGIYKALKKCKELREERGDLDIVIKIFKTDTDLEWKMCDEDE